MNLRTLSLSLGLALAAALPTAALAQDPPAAVQALPEISGPGGAPQTGTGTAGSAAQDSAATGATTPESRRTVNGGAPAAGQAVTGAGAAGTGAGSSAAATADTATGTTGAAATAADPTDTAITGTDPALAGTDAAAPGGIAAAATGDAATTAAPAAAPSYEPGNVAWMMTATALVLFMSLPGLALFYGGLVRKKNMLSTLTQTFAIFSLIAVLWVVYGYSVAFSQGSTAFFGGFSKLMLAGVVTTDGYTTFVPTATFSKGVVIPELMFAMFQLTFACITVALAAGAYAERMKFKAVLIFSVIFFTFAYLPLAHMVWWWAGPDAYGSADVVDATNATAGYLWQMGALDFAGGTVVHINAGVAGLMCALFVGRRSGIGRVAMRPHSLTLSMVGAAMLWFGWFGFNAGSNLEANGYAVLAFANTLFATSVAALAWFFAEWILKGKPSLLGIVSGAVAGLVAITPACGFVGIQGALWIGLVAGVLCYLAVAFLKPRLGYDDALDAFGVHAVGGIIGAILTGVFVDPAKGGVGVYNNWFEMKPGYDAAQILIQVKAVVVAVVLSAVVSAIALLICKFTVGLRVTEEEESEGLDIAEHGEAAYHD